MAVSAPSRIAYPGNRRFALTIVDDTDGSTLENTRPVYEFLRSLGFRTTKTVWPLAGRNANGSSLEDPAYAEFVRQLQAWGNEIALHNVQDGSADRARIEAGLERFCQVVGSHPRTHCNHMSNRDNLYWGPARLRSPIVRWSYQLASRFRDCGRFTGHIPESPYFWGDLCRQRIEYVRNLVWDEINLENINPTLPYTDASKPYVRFWFSSCDGANVDSFCRLLCDANQQRLEDQAGVAIVYTHFASGFCHDGRLDPRFVLVMKGLANRNGWFVPVAELLDFRRQQLGDLEIPAGELKRMERRWLRYKMRVGVT